MVIRTLYPLLEWFLSARLIEAVSFLKLHSADHTGTIQDQTDRGSGLSYWVVMGQGETLILTLVLSVCGVCVCIECKCEPAACVIISCGWREAGGGRGGGPRFSAHSSTCFLSLPPLSPFLLFYFSSSTLMFFNSCTFKHFTQIVNFTYCWVLIFNLPGRRIQPFVNYTFLISLQKWDQGQNQSHVYALHTEPHFPAASSGYSKPKIHLPN